MSILLIFSNFNIKSLVTYLYQITINTFTNNLKGKKWVFLDEKWVIVDKKWVFVFLFWFEWIIGYTKK